MFCAEFPFFAAHDEGIDQGERDEEQDGDNPGMHGDGNAEGEETAAEVQRVAGVGVGAGDGKDFLLVEITGGVGANDEADEADGGTEKNGVERGTREEKHDDGQEIAEANAPAREEVGGGHESAPRRRCTASKT